MKKEINYNEFKKIKDVDVFFDVLRMGKIISLLCVDDNNVAHYTNGGLIMGVLLDDFFVTLEDSPKVFPIDLEMGKGFFYTDDQPGMYVTELFYMKPKDEDLDEYKPYIEKYKKVEKWFFDEYLPGAMSETSYSPDEISAADKIYDELTGDSKVIKIQKK